MNLKEYIEGLQKFAKENPSMLDKQVIYSADDEGNRYGPVNFTPSISIMDDDYECICIEEDEFDEDLPDSYYKVCIN